jgi:hypothetical protein
MHCPVCHIVVAPHDPERVEKGDQVYHRGCLRKQQPKQIPLQLNCRAVQAPKQKYFRFVVAQMIH